MRFIVYVAAADASIKAIHVTRHHSDDEVERLIQLNKGKPGSNRWLRVTADSRKDALKFAEISGFGQEIETPWLMERPKAKRSKKKKGLAFPQV